MSLTKRIFGADSSEKKVVKTTNLPKSGKFHPKTLDKLFEENQVWIHYPAYYPPMSDNRISYIVNRHDEYESNLALLLGLDRTEDYTKADIIEGRVNSFYAFGVSETSPVTEDSFEKWEENRNNPNYYGVQMMMNLCHVKSIDDSRKPICVARDLARKYFPRYKITTLFGETDSPENFEDNKSHSKIHVAISGADVAINLFFPYEDFREGFFKTLGLVKDFHREFKKETKDK